MNKEHTQKLIDTFPQLYRGREEASDKNLMCFGFECGNGWFDLIYNLSKKIDATAKRLGLSGDDYPKAFQVKEKFGALRFYFANGVPEEIFQLVSQAEAESMETCDVCGAPATQSKSGYWIRTVCEKHARRDEIVDETD